MSSDYNKPIIKKAQALFKEQGYEIKVGQLYEIFAKLAGEESWNVASAKKVSFQEKILTPLTNLNQSQVDLKKIYEKEFLKPLDNEVLLGYLIEQQKIVRKSLMDEPNSLFVGSLGSGKSTAMVSTVLSFIKQNPTSLVFIVDLIKGAKDFNPLFKLDKVIPVLDSPQKLYNVIDLLFDELYSRMKEFKKVEASNINDFEEKTKSKMDRCMLVIEEFHSIPYQHLYFDKNYKTPNTAAYKFHQLMRMGRSVGIWITAATSRATRTEVPAELIPNFSHKQVFRVSSAESSYLLGHTKASDLTVQEQGVCETEEGKVAFPFYSPEELKEMVKHINSSDFKCEYINMELIREALKVKTDEEQINSKSLIDLVQNINQFDKLKVLSLVHQKQGAIVESVDHVNSVLIVKQKSQKTAIIFKDLIKAKDLFALHRYMQEGQIDKGIIYTLDDKVPSSLYKYALDLKLDIIDREDLGYIVKMLEKN